MDMSNLKTKSTRHTNEEESCLSFFLPNQLAPDFSAMGMINNQLKEIKLSDYKGKYLVLIFYPKDFSCIWASEIICFSDKIEEFKKINCEILACSTDSLFCHQSWIKTERSEGGLSSINIPILSDQNFQISRDYKVFNENEGIAYSSLFIIDNKAKIRQSIINDVNVTMSVGQILQLVQACQNHDKLRETDNKSTIPTTFQKLFSNLLYQKK